MIINWLAHAHGLWWVSKLLLHHTGVLHIDTVHNVGIHRLSTRIVLLQMAGYLLVIHVLKITLLLSLIVLLVVVFIGVFNLFVRLESFWHKLSCLFLTQSDLFRMVSVLSAQSFYLFSISLSILFQALLQIRNFSAKIVDLLSMLRVEVPSLWIHGRFTLFRNRHHWRLLHMFLTSSAFLAIQTSIQIILFLVLLPELSNSISIFSSSILGSLPWLILLLSCSHFLFMFLQKDSSLFLVLFLIPEPFSLAVRLTICH